MDIHLYEPIQLISLNMIYEQNFWYMLIFLFVHDTDFSIPHFRHEIAFLILMNEISLNEWTFRYKNL